MLFIYSVFYYYMAGYRLLGSLTISTEKSIFSQPSRNIGTAKRVEYIASSPYVNTINSQFGATGPRKIYAT